MKNFRRSVRRFIPSIIFSVIFTLLFPYSLMAQNPEYKIPERSMSYLAQAQDANKTTEDANQNTATLSNSDRQELEPEFANQTSETAKIEIVSEPAPVKSEIHNKIKITKTAAVTPKKTPAKPAAKEEVQISEASVTSESADKPVFEISSKSKSEAPLFSEALKKMQQNRSQRQAEAARLGIVLPSQGGDMAAVSPSLSKMQQTLRNIMAR